MIKVLFVCLGNICRSPMAEFLFKDMIKKRNLENQFLIESAATSSEEEGNSVYYKAQENAYYSFKVLFYKIFHSPFIKYRETLI